MAKSPPLDRSHPLGVRSASVYEKNETLTPWVRIRPLCTKNRYFHPLGVRVASLQAGFDGELDEIKALLEKVRGVGWYAIGGCEG